MSNVRGKIFCQRCKSPNELGEDLCGRCGTRLMLLVEPSAARFEGRGVAAGMEEHLLERVTAIENNISRVIDKLERMAELMLKQSRSAYFDHELLDTLITVLGEAGVISRKRLGELWRERRGREEAGQGAARARFEELRESVLARYAGPEEELFGRLVREGFESLERGRTKAGLRSLERAAALAPDNAPLNAFLGEQLYRKGQTAPARDYFSRAFDADPANARLRLLLGLACGDEGEPGRARELLTEAVAALGRSFAAHCALGRLSAADSDWKGALAEFRLALRDRPGPEADYLVGLASFELRRDRTALRHLRKAVGADEGYAAAFYLLGLALLRLGEREEALRAFESAAAIEPDDTRYRDARENPESAAVPPQLFEPARRGRRLRLVTGGDARLSAALLEDALGNHVPR